MRPDCRPKVSRTARLSALAPSTMNKRAISGFNPRSTKSASSALTTAAFSVAPKASASTCLSRLAIRVARKLKAVDVIDVLSDLFILRGVPRMALRWTGTAMLEAAKSFRRLKAHKQLPVLRAALLRHQQALLGDQPIASKNLAA
jgi:hypothetical protein